MKNLPYAETMPYWKSGKSSPETWLSKAEAVIEKLGGTVTMRAQGNAEAGKAYLIDFQFLPDRFRAIWPVLPTKTKSKANARSAEIQAATMMYHDVKARSLRSSVFGPRTAFFEFVLLPDGRTAGQLTNQQLISFTPAALLPPAQ